MSVSGVSIRLVGAAWAAVVLLSASAAAGPLPVAPPGDLPGPLPTPALRDAVAEAKETAKGSLESLPEHLPTRPDGKGEQDTPPQPQDDGTPPPTLQDARPLLRAVRERAGNAAERLPSDPVPTLTGLAMGTAQRAAREVGRVTAPLLAPAADEGARAQAVPTGAQASDRANPYPLIAGGILVASAAGATFLGMWLAGSSGTMGAAGAGTTAAGRDLRRLLPFASPLFTRFEKDTVLGHPRREALYALILRHPGISLQALGDATGLSRTAVLHHLRLMELQHLVVSKRMGRSRHYYENGGRFGHDQKEAYAILQNPRSKEVADYIRAHPGAMQKSLCEALGIPPSIAHWHVRRLQLAALVEAIRRGRTVTYYPGRPLREMVVPAASAMPAT